jgi:uncharacterized protein (DUF1015 family)
LAKIFGLAGLRPGAGWAEKVTCPPYDVIKPGSPLEALLKKNPDSLYHVILGDSPLAGLSALRQKGALLQDEEPGFYVYEQCWGESRRLGFLAAPAVSGYERQEIIRHEKTFDEKVQGRIKLMAETGYVTEPIWLLTRVSIAPVLEQVCAGSPPLYEFISDFQGESELSGISNRVFKVAADSIQGRLLQDKIGEGPLYIADGHHRYHSALKMGLDRCVAYVCQADQATIQAYNRVIRSKTDMEAIEARLPLEPAAAFATPPRHSFTIYTRQGCWQYKAPPVASADVVAALDCRILEDALYPVLGLRHDMIMDSRYFDYYPEQDLAKMRRLVDQGVYDLAVALHPVQPGELLAVADAGLLDPEIVMPEKSTFFAPKILSGLILIPTAKP